MKYTFIMMLALCLSMVSMLADVEMAQGKAHLSKKSVVVSVGKSKSISLYDSMKKKSRGISSGKSRIKLSKRTGTTIRVFGVKAGVAKIWAKASGKTYRCKVTVKKKTVSDSSSYVVNMELKGHMYKVCLVKNDSTKALLSRLPMTIKMQELNGNEKYHYLSDSLPSKSSVPKKILAGDLMLYGDDCIVLFYKSFSSSYSYTPLGHADIDNLSSIVGSGSVEVKLSR